MDDGLLLKSLPCVVESLEELMGPNGAREMLHSAGHKPAANLIGALPLHLLVEDTVTRSADWLGELGFADIWTVDGAGDVRLSDLPIKCANHALDLAADGAGEYFCIGPLEECSRQMSSPSIQVDKCSQHGLVQTWSLKA